MASTSVLKQWQKAEEVLDKYRSTILGKAGVVHVGVAYRIKQARKGKGVPKLTNEVGICVSVLKKRKNQFPAAYDGVPVDVIAITGRNLASGAIEPGQGIFQADHSPDDFGTLGMVAFDQDDLSLRYFLTCAHVLPDIGKDVKSKLPGQPTIGAVKDSQRSSLVDCAIVKPKDGLVFTDAIPGVASPPPYALGEITIKDKQNQSPVFKVGAKTHLTRGKVVAHDGSIDVGKKLMINQIGVLGDKGPFTFSKGGDSGAVLFRGKADVVNPAPEIVGLVVAERGDGISMASHFHEVARC